MKSETHRIIYYIHTTKSIIEIIRIIEQKRIIGILRHKQILSIYISYDILS